jgi:putative phosphoesterase
MRIGVFADSHDHLDHIREAVNVFNRENCELVLFAGDLISSFAVPPLRELNCPVIACFGDNEGNKIGVTAGFKILGEIGEPPLCLRLPDGTRLLMTHMLSQVRGLEGEFDACIYAHTHKPELWHDDRGRLYLNPGETSGWSFGRPTVAILETQPLAARFVALSDASQKRP